VRYTNTLTYLLIYLLTTRAAAACGGRIMGQTDGRTLVGFTDPTLDTIGLLTADNEFFLSTLAALRDCVAE